MAEVVWTPRAYADLEAIGDYHAQSETGYAVLLVRKLLFASERLKTFPASGRMVPEIGDDNMREIIHRNYRIIYLYIPEDDRVEILTVFHASRQFGPSATD